MFEDALVESAGKLRTRSRYWMFATLAFNLAVLAAMILIPLLHPEALPKTSLTAMLTAPPPPPPPPPTVHVQPATARTTVQPLNPMTAPARVPTHVDLSKEAPPPAPLTNGVSGSMSAGNGPADGVLNALGIGTAPAVTPRPVATVRRAGPLTISSGVAAGAILTRTTPVYPAIAKAAHVSGAVVLHAIISRAGAIESLQVVSGPEMLRASAVAAVRQWRYKPYLLNGDPTDVETTVTVNFSFGG